MTDVGIELVLVEDAVIKFDHGQIPTKKFDIVLKNSGQRVGGISLRYTDNPYLTNFRGHAGFKIEEPFRRNGYASAACLLVMAIANDLGMKTIVMTCRPDNLASEKTILRAGLSYDDTVDVPENTYLWNHDIRRIKRFSKSLGSL